MTPEEIVTSFLEALEGFEPIADQPGDVDLERLREALYGLLLPIPYNEELGKQNLVGMLMDGIKYQSIYGVSFVRPRRPKAYPDGIGDDTKAVTYRKLEAEHKAKQKDYASRRC